MNEGTPRLLFVPVSGAFGMGEYARSLAIAWGAAARWPNAAIHFLLSREAPYAAGTPFPCTLLASSPTFHTAAVVEFIERWRPDVVIFDNAGRTAQLRAARRGGAGVIYVSARRRQRSKAFRMRWMRLIDEHWIAYPEFIAGSLNVLERFKLRVLRRPVVRYLDVILAAPIASQRESIESRWGVVGDGYVLVVPGGGTGHPGAGGAIEQFRAAADGLAVAGIATLFVGGSRSPPSSGASPVAPSTRAAPAVVMRSGAAQVLGLLPQAELAELMRGARVIVANGGSTLLQSIACGRPCIAVPIATDQNERVRHCVRAGVAIDAPLQAAAILRTAQTLFGNEPQCEVLAGRAIALGLRDGVGVALLALDALIAARPR